MEKIIAINEHSEEIDDMDMSGYVIETNKQRIRLLMQDEQMCCEDFGYFMSEDDIGDFIGADLVEIKITDTELKEGLLKKRDIGILDECYSGGVMFVDILTSKGVLQFVAYNEHNGYYGHTAKVISEQLNHKERL